MKENEQKRKDIVVEREVSEDYFYKYKNKYKKNITLDALHSILNEFAKNNFSQVEASVKSDRILENLTVKSVEKYKKYYSKIEAVSFNIHESHYYIRQTGTEQTYILIEESPFDTPKVSIITAEEIISKFGKEVYNKV